MEIKNFENSSLAQVEAEVHMGAKFVIFEYCISVLIVSFKRWSSIYYIKPGESVLKHSWPFLLLTFFLGWWGIPWGPIYSFESYFVNFRGGKDVTDEVIHSLKAQ